MFSVDSSEAASFFLSEFGDGEDCCLRDVSIKASTWVDDDGSMHFGSLDLSASMTLQRQSQENTEARIIFKGIKRFRINGLDKDGYDGIIQNLRLEISKSGTCFSAHDSFRNDAFEYFCVEAEEMHWEVADKRG